MCSCFWPILWKNGYSLHCDDGSYQPPRPNSSSTSETEPSISAAKRLLHRESSTCVSRIAGTAADDGLGGFSGDATVQCRCWICLGGVSSFRSCLWAYEITTRCVSRRQQHKVRIIHHSLLFIVLIRTGDRTLSECLLFKQRYIEGNQGLFVLQCLLGFGIIHLKCLFVISWFCRVLEKQEEIVLPNGIRYISP